MNNVYLLFLFVSINHIPQPKSKHLVSDASSCVFVIYVISFGAYQGNELNVGSWRIYTVNLFAKKR